MKPFAILALLLSLLAPGLNAATLGSTDPMQPQIIVLRMNAQGRVLVEFCPKGDPNECLELGDRKTGYSREEMKELAEEARANARYWLYAKPLSQLLLMAGSGVAAASGGFLGLLTGGVLFSAATEIEDDKTKAPEHWALLARVTDPRMARPHATFQWDFDVLAFGRELDALLKTRPNHLALCECRSTYPADRNKALPEVTGRGKEFWQARMNAQYLCSIEIEKRTRRYPSLDYPAAVSFCRGREL